MRNLMIGVSALALVAACTPDPTQPSFFGEAGLAANDGGFGQATLNNVLVQSGERGYAEALGARFAATVPQTVTFAFNSDALDANARRALATQAAFIRSFPEVRFSVTGHADLVGSERYNRDLGLRRARAAVAFIESQGVAASRLQALVSEGETMPVVPTAGPARANRRAVTTVSGFVRGNPTVLNGRYAEIVFRDYVASAAAPTTLEGTAATDLASTGGQ